MRNGGHAELSPLGLAAMYSEALLIKRDGRGAVLRGGIFATDLGETDAHVKLSTGDGRRLYAETLAAATAHALGLSAPRAYMVMVYPSAYPELAEPTWGFGSITQHPAIAAPLSGNDQETYAAIQRWASFHALCVFDEWFANNDRTPENLLFDGRSFTLLDHGEALPESLSPRHRAPGGNIQLDRAALTLCEFEKHQAIKKLKLAGAIIPAIPIHHAKKAINARWTQNGEGIIDDMTAFLHARVPHLDTLLRKALNMPTQAEKLL